MSTTHDAGDHAGTATSPTIPSTSSPAATPGTAPVDDHTYNLLQALTSTLEAIDAYEMYAEEDESGGIFAELLVDQRRHAERLLDELRSCLVPAGR